MKKVLITSASFLLALMLLTASWAAETPIGALVVEGKIDITTGDMSFTLEDQEYAYFSDDRIALDGQSRASVTTSDGLKISFLPTTEARITKDNSGYSIDLQAGAMVIDAKQDVEYEVIHNGKAVSVPKSFSARGEPYVVTVAPDTRDVRFYMPAQLAQAGFFAGLTQAQLAALIAAGVITSGVIINETVLKDDEEPSS